MVGRNLPGVMLVGVVLVALALGGMAFAQRMGASAKTLAPDISPAAKDVRSFIPVAVKYRENYLRVLNEAFCSGGECIEDRTFYKDPYPVSAPGEVSVIFDEPASEASVWFVDWSDVGHSGMIVASQKDVRVLDLPLDLAPGNYTMIVDAKYAGADARYSFQVMLR